MNEQMRQYLDAPIDRHGTNCEKWDMLGKYFGRDDLLAAWVADMDFRTAPPIIEAMRSRLEHGIFGYTYTEDEERPALIGWMKRRYDLALEPEWILPSPGVVDSIFFCVRALTRPGDRIALQTPVYGPFFMAAKLFECEVAENPLIAGADGFRMDLDGLRDQFKAGGVKALVLCNPHNPVGRVWTRGELSALVELCNEYGVTIIADEIHADFAFDGRRTTRLLSLPGAERHSMLTSSTKSFNIAGLRMSSMIIPDEALREKVFHELEKAHAAAPNLFGSIAQTAAYTSGDEWMDAVVEYICENRDFVAEQLRRRLPKIAFCPPEGTYLMWLDFRAFGLAPDEMAKLLVNEARVALNPGTDYGERGAGWFRLNLATPRRNLVELLDRLENALRGR